MTEWQDSVAGEPRAQSRRTRLTHSSSALVGLSVVFVLTCGSCSPMRGLGGASATGAPTQSGAAQVTGSPMATESEAATSSPGAGSSEVAATPPPLVGLTGDVPPPGNLVVQASGIGNGRITIPADGSASRISLRISCSGPGQVNITKDGETLLNLTGCSPVAAYGTELELAKSPYSVLVNAQPATSWRVGVWVKTG